MDERRWKVGELAQATGLTVRALHHFDEIGLVRPAERSGTGHRLYTPGDVRRLRQVLTLRRLGMPLSEIGKLLDGAAGDLELAVLDQLEHVKSQIEAQQRLRTRLAALRAVLGGSPASATDQLIDRMEATMEASYFTPEQLTRLKERHREAGDEGFARWQRRWAELVDEVRGHIEGGTDPANPAAQTTARRWAELMDRLTGGDRAILSAMYAKLDGQGAESATRGVVSVDVWDYIKRSFAVGFGPATP